VRIRLTYFVRQCERRLLLLQLFGPVLLLQQTPRRLLHPVTTNQNQSVWGSSRILIPVEKILIEWAIEIILIASSVAFYCAARKFICSLVLLWPWRFSLSTEEILFSREDITKKIFFSHYYSFLVSSIYTLQVGFIIFLFK